MYFFNSENLRKIIFVASFFVLIFGSYESLTAQRIRLRSQVTPECDSGTSTNKFADISADGNIAVQGSYNCRGAFIYDITEGVAPVLAAHYNPSDQNGVKQRFLEAIIVGNRGYFGSGNGGGVHIVDLSDPRNPQLLGVVNSARGNGHDSIHEMLVWGNYLIENYNGFSNKIIKVINVANPANPVFVRDINPTEIQWVHAMHIRGNRLFTSGWGNSNARARTEIYDIQSIAEQAPKLLGYIEDATSITAGNNMHSSWTSEDGNYLYSCREVVTTSTSTSPEGDLRTYDITNPAQPVLVNRITTTGLGLNAVTPHNPVVMGSLLFVSWYQAGLQVFDLSTPTAPRWIGQYDTFPETYQPVETSSVSKNSFQDPWELVCGTQSLQNNLPTNFEGNWAVFPFLGLRKVLLGDMTKGLIIVDVGRAAPRRRIRGTIAAENNNDGFSAFAESGNSFLAEQFSSHDSERNNYAEQNKTILKADFDGDEKNDFASWNPASGEWTVSTAQKISYKQNFGLKNDVPVPADYDADGKTDLAVWRPENGTWYIQNSTLGFRAVRWGMRSDKVLTGDFDADGKADLVVFRPSNGTWYVLQSTSSLPIIKQFGLAVDKPLAGDFDGDGKFDFTVFRPSEGKWYILNSSDSSLSIYNFGEDGDAPFAEDFDGDGKTDIGFYRAQENAFYQLNSSNKEISVRNLGQRKIANSDSLFRP